MMAKVRRMAICSAKAVCASAAAVSGAAPEISVLMLLFQETKSHGRLRRDRRKFTSVEV